MTVRVDTKAQKRQREKDLIKHLEQIKIGGKWRQWVNGSELYIAKLCRHLGKIKEDGTIDENGTAWDASCFRGGNWAAPLKEDFNKWVKRQLAEERETATDLFGNPLRTIPVLPPGLTFDGLPDEMVDFIRDKLSEIKWLKDKVVTLETQLVVKERKVLELQTQIDSVIDAERAKDEHYLFSIRTLKYD